jgi:hypothetical protein
MVCWRKAISFADQLLRARGELGGEKRRRGVGLRVGSSSASWVELVLERVDWQGRVW